jgi:hypothetical protein
MIMIMDMQWTYTLSITFISFRITFCIADDTFSKFYFSLFQMIIFILRLCIYLAQIHFRQRTKVFEGALLGHFKRYTWRKFILTYLNLHQICLKFKCLLFYMFIPWLLMIMLNYTRNNWLWKTLQEFRSGRDYIAASETITLISLSFDVELWFIFFRFVFFSYINLKLIFVLFFVFS